MSEPDGGPAPLPFPPAPRYIQFRSPDGAQLLTVIASSPPAFIRQRLLYALKCSSIEEVSLQAGPLACEVELGSACAAACQTLLAPPFGEEVGPGGSRLVPLTASLLSLPPLLPPARQWRARASASSAASSGAHARAPPGGQRSAGSGRSGASTAAQQQQQQQLNLEQQRQLMLTPEWRQNQRRLVQAGFERYIQPLLRRFLAYEKLSSTAPISRQTKSTLAAALAAAAAAPPPSAGGGAGAAGGGASSAEQGQPQSAGAAAAAAAQPGRDAGGGEQGQSAGAGAAAAAAGSGAGSGALSGAAMGRSVAGGAARTEQQMRGYNIHHPFFRGHHVLVPVAAKGKNKDAFYGTRRSCCVLATACLPTIQQ